MSITNAVSVSVSTSRVTYDYNAEDDLISIQRFLFRALDAANQDPVLNLYRWPLEETFHRPAVTVRLLPGARESDASARRNLSAGNYDLMLPILITAYGEDRAKTIELGQRIVRALYLGHEGRPMSIPLYSKSMGLVLARSLRVVRPSPVMGIEDTDDEGKWSVPVNVSVIAPRLRLPSSVGSIHQIVTG